MLARGTALREHFLAWLRYRADEARIATARPLFDGVVAMRPDE
jgi:hypothetical protein